MTDRVELLEQRVASLTETVAALGTRLDALERAAAPRPAAELPSAREQAAGEPEDAAAGFGAQAGSAPTALAGRAFLGVGGAYLFRALTEAGSLPHLAGVALGLLYGGAWAFAAERSGRRGRTRDATLHGLLALAVSFPLLWETTVRMRALPPLASAGLLTAVGVSVFVVAWRHDLAGVAWAATLGAVATAWGLLLATTRIELFAALLIAFGAATLWATYGRRWHGLRWPAALAADLSVATLVYLAGRPGGPPEAYASLEAGRAVLVALLLFVVYAGSFAARTLARRRPVNVFEVFQTAAVLLVGYGGAVRLAHAAGTGETALGVAALLLAALAYGAAFGFVQRDSAGGRNFLFFAALALVLALTGGGLLAAGSALALVWTLFGFAAVVLGARFGRTSLIAHGAAYLTAAGLQAGLFAATVSAFASPLGGAPVPPGAAVVAITVAAAVSWGVTARWRRRDPGAKGAGASAPVLLALAAAGAGVGAVLALLAVLPAGSVAPARTAVLALSAVALASLRNVSRAEEAGWFAWTVLFAAALRILLQDLPAGRPVPLFVGFVLCGAALLAVSRLQARGRSGRGREDTDVSAPAAARNGGGAEGAGPVAEGPARP